MSCLDKLTFFEKWLEKNPSLWKRKAEDISVPDDFEYLFGRSINPTYLEFLQKLGAFFLIPMEGQNPPVYDYETLTPSEMMSDFNENIIRWNNPVCDFDFGYMMPFCRDRTAGWFYCFDIKFQGVNDLPVVLFDPMCAIPGDELKIATTFIDWLKLLAKYNNLSGGKL